LEEIVEKDLREGVERREKEKEGGSWEEEEGERWWVEKVRRSREGGRKLRRESKVSSSR
jgi:hypothetical protein